MTLSATLEALSVNEKLNVTILNLAEQPLITFNAPGYESIEDDLGPYPVLEIRVKAGNAVSIKLGDEPNLTPDPDPDPNGGD